MSAWAPRRFWTEVAVEPAPDGWEVRLDGRPVRTPARATLRLPTRAFADAVAAEWAAQEGTVDPRTMPATRLANVALDRLAAARPEVEAMLLGYGASDLLCYRAEAPPRLAQRQREGWDPLLDWAADALGARLRVGAGVMPVSQPPEALERLAVPLAALDDFRLAALHDLVTIPGSLVLALAVLEGRLDAAAAWDLSRLDEEAQAEDWGRDDEAEAAAALKRRDFETAARFLDALRPAS